MTWDAHRFGARVRSTREMRQLTQQQLADATGLHPTAISHMESGERGPSAQTLVRVADGLRVSTDYLLGRTSDLWGAVHESIAISIAQLPDADRRFLEVWIAARLSCADTRTGVD